MQRGHDAAAGELHAWKWAATVDFACPHQTCFRIRGIIPAKLPNLEELVSLASESLDAPFEDPTATFTTLKNFYAFCKLNCWGCDASRIGSIRQLTSGI